MLRLRDVDLGVLNSLTKYPSIPTYHTLDKSNGDLLEETVPFDPTYVVRVTEKVDGTNARIIVLPSGEWLLGSREEQPVYPGGGAHVCGHRVASR